jgi:hypothetical protein
MKSRFFFLLCTELCICIVLSVHIPDLCCSYISGTGRCKLNSCFRRPIDKNENCMTI